MASIYIIAAACLIALFAYPLAPDSSPNANRMIAGLGTRSPGFTKLFLLQPRQKTAGEKSFIARLFTGTEPAYNLLPINSFFFARDSIIVEHYINARLQDTLSFPLKTLLPAIAHQPPGRQQMAVYHDALSRRTFYLGTDQYGRDIVSRLLVGTRVSMVAGIVAVLLSLGIGVLLGALAGYFSGWVDNAVMYLVNILSAIPAPLLVFAITLSLGTGILQISIAIGLTMWVGAARDVRGQVLALRKLEYIQAAKTLGLSHTRIIFRHILPNITGPLMVMVASNFAAAILIEAGLSFLGIGVQPPTPSWGLMVREHVSSLTGHPAMVLIPGIAIVMLACAFTVLGNALRDLLDVRKL